MSVRGFALFGLVLQNRTPRLARWLAWLRREIVIGVVLAPLEPILHASQWRLGWVGAMMLFGNPLFGWLWLHHLPQPWDSMEVRFGASLLALLLLLMAVWIDVRAKSAQLAFNLVVFLNLPLLFNWMYLCNGGNKVWLASAVAMLLIYYHLVDWRIATAGVVSGAVGAWMLFQIVGPTAPVPTSADMQVNALVLGFAWAVAIVLGFSTANVRRLHLRRTLTTIGIVAHELRTPLATVTLISQALHGVAGRSQPPQVAGSIEALAQRLGSVARTMNHQIDMQVMNARLLHLTPPREPVTASRLITQAIDDFPFRSVEDRSVVVVDIRQDFVFSSSPALFGQVLGNLMTNALRALAATDRSPQAGDIVIRADRSGARGILTVADRGVGIPLELKERIFEPFFSGDSHTGNGLGLALCKRVVKSAGGSIEVRSQPGQGATFVIQLPLAQL